MLGYIGLGSNQGHRRSNLARGLAALSRADVHPRRLSSIWETEPVDCPFGGRFLNLVAEVDTVYAPRPLLEKLQAIEDRLGRTRTLRNGPRTIDLDLLLLGDASYRDAELELPHPRMWQRRFVLAPLAELVPELKDPATGRTVAEWLATLPAEPTAERVARLELPARPIRSVPSRRPRPQNSSAL